jgi:FMN phosphatase YigB (HAD superfamily)
MKSILIDLDNTLIRFHDDAFLKTYFKAMTHHFASLGYDGENFVPALLYATEMMRKNNGKQTNERLFYDVFCRKIPVNEQKLKHDFLSFYQTTYDQVAPFCTPITNANTLIEKLKLLNIPIILATNPLFPKIAVEKRLRWGGIHQDDFLFITSIETSHYCKPNPLFFQEILDRYHLKNHDTLMIGNDVVEDGAAFKVGIKTYIIEETIMNAHADQSGLNLIKLDALIDDFS